MLEIFRASFRTEETICDTIIGGPQVTLMLLSVFQFLEVFWQHSVQAFDKSHLQPNPDNQLLERKKKSAKTRKGLPGPGHLLTLWLHLEIMLSLISFNRGGFWRGDLSLMDKLSPFLNLKFSMFKQIQRNESTYYKCII